MYYYGGIYADLDFKCLKSFNNILNMNYDIILGQMGDDKDFKDSIPNALMISKPYCDFWLYVICNMKKRVNKSKPEYDTGPQLLKYCVDTYKGKNKIKILPKQYFYPINWNSADGISMKDKIINKKKIEGDYKNSYAVTYWSHSW